MLIYPVHQLSRSDNLLPAQLLNPSRIVLVVHPLIHHVYASSRLLSLRSAFPKS